MSNIKMKFNNQRFKIILVIIILFGNKEKKEAEEEADQKHLKEIDKIYKYISYNYLNEK
jgi:hypothetical protein